MTKIVAALLVLLCNLVAGHPAALAQDAATEAATASSEAQRAVDLAVLTGTAEGLYRGCKVAQEWRRNERFSESDIALAIDLMSDCTNFVEGATALTFFEVKILSTCSITSPMDTDQIIDEIVSVVKRDPVKIGVGQKREWLLRLAMFNLAGCK